MRKKVQREIKFLLIVILALLIAVLATKVPLPAPTKINQTIVFSGDCGILKQQMETLFEDSNYCTSDNDCMIKEYDCPFGCYQTLNKNAPFRVIEEGINKYSAKCEQCMYDCVMPAELTLACIEGKCKVMELS